MKTEQVVMGRDAENVSLPSYYNKEKCANEIS